MLIRRVLSLVVALVAGATLLVPPGAARAQDAETIPWTDALPPAPADYEGTLSHLCPGGQLRCVDVVVREMTRRFDRLARRCDHDAVFALTYLRTTETYRRAVSDPNFFTDNAFVNHQDVVFADYYLRAYDGHHRGRPVPGAWATAFRAADQREVTATGNQLLGINAHVNYDLPFVLAEIGIVKPDGSSRKPDHDRVNDFLVTVTEPLLAEIAARFDPTADDGYVAGTSLDETATFQLLASWREAAWRNAERLVNAPTPEARDRVAQEIEANATMIGETLARTYRYIPPVNGPGARDTHCAAGRSRS